MFKRSIIEWISADAYLRQQLPFLYQLLGVYSRIFFRLRPSADHLTGGRYVLHILSTLQGKRVNQGYATIVVDKYTACIDLTDPRFLLTINELKRLTDTKVLSQLLEEGDTFVDVGANQGTYSIIASHLVGSIGYIVSIEPQNRLAHAIERSLAESPVTKYKVYQVAVGDHKGETTLIVPYNYSGMAGLYRNFSGLNGYYECKVSMRRFDDLVDWKNFKGQVLIKLDIEGSEFAFLQGASRMIDALRPTILMELNPQALNAAGTGIVDIKEMLKSLGYRTYSEAGNPSETFSIEDLPISHQNILLQGNKKAGFE
ncbi:MAG: FkbM family methyltransferase [Anaerolineales bacterium]|nr:FkbM family methyltransferase [Anaerolineales bacterium]